MTVADNTDPRSPLSPQLVLSPLCPCSSPIMGHQNSEAMVHATLLIITKIVTSHCHFCSCQLQPIKGLVSPEAMARMTVAESLTNIMWAKVSALGDIKASGNWMWASKLPGECARMYAACEALREALLATGVGIDGGKVRIGYPPDSVDGY